MKAPLLHNGPLMRTPKNERLYLMYRKTKPSGCDFCSFDASKPHVIVEKKYFWVIQNLFPYAVWDGCRVQEHFMVVPKRHVVSMGEFIDEEKAEYMDTIAYYEQSGYSIYSRTDLSVTKSVPHQHTHLIKIEPKKLTSLVYRSKPHILLYK